MKYNFLDADEAEERFEQRNKTLNYFSIMLSKRMKQSEDGEESGAPSTGEKKEVLSSKERNKASAGSGLVCVCVPDDLYLM